MRLLIAYTYVYTSIIDESRSRITVSEIVESKDLNIWIEHSNNDIYYAVKQYLSTNKERAEVLAITDLDSLGNRGQSL